MDIHKNFTFFFNSHIKDGGIEFAQPSAKLFDLNQKTPEVKII